MEECIIYNFHYADDTVLLTTKEIYKKSRVDRLLQLGTTLNSQWNHAEQIRSRIETAQPTFIRIRPVLCCNDVSLNIKMRIADSYWTGSWCKLQKKRSKPSISGSTIGIEDMDHVINVKVLRRMSKEKEVLNTVKQRKLEYIGSAQRRKIPNTSHAGQNIWHVGTRTYSWLKNLRQWFRMTSTAIFRRAVNKTIIALMYANSGTK